MTTTAGPLAISSSFCTTTSHRLRAMPVVSAKPQSFSTPLSPLARQRFVSCDVALKPDSTTVDASSSDEESIGAAKIGARIRVKVPLKVYHVPKVPELDVTGMEGVLKQYVGLWKGKRISANLPFKVEFVTNVDGRGTVKFFAHLKEDEFDYVEDGN